MPTYLVGPTRPYTTIQSAVNAIPSTITGTGIHEVIIDASTYTENVSVPAKTGVNSANYVWIHAASGSEHNYSLTSGVIVHSNGVTSQPTVKIQASFTVLENIVAKPNQGFNLGVISVQSSDCTIINVLGVMLASTGTCTIFESTQLNLPRNVFINCFAIDQGASLSFGFTNQSSTGYFYNCGCFNTTIGFTSVSGTSTTAVNCFAYGQSSSTDFTGSFTNSNYNASRGTSAPGANSLISKTLAQFGFVNSGSNDFHITTNSVLYGAGTNLSSTFTTDIDLETIGIWCIGPDSFIVVVPASTTSSSTGINKQSDQQDAPKDAKAPRLKTLTPESAPKLSRESDVSESSAPPRQIKKGYKDGFLSLMPEVNGYSGVVSNGTGNRLPILEEKLSANQSFVNLSLVSTGRHNAFRVQTFKDPGGMFVAPLRTNDCIPLFQSHFQKRIGTTPASGTTYYEFACSRDGLNMSGSSFGTGSFNSVGSYSAFSVSLYKQVEGSSYRFTGGLCDNLKFSFDSRGEALISPDMVFGSVTTAGTNLGLPYGSYSSLPHFSGHQFSLDFLGLPVIGFELESKNNIKKFYPVGATSPRHKFGRYEVNGQAMVDITKVSLAHFGSMIGASSFAVTGTLYGDERNKMVFQMPNCRLRPYELNINNTTVNVPFSCYQSEDGGTAPLTIKLWTRNYSGTSFEPN